jgi:hypothetical protein
VALAMLPGATLWHEGQFEGRRVRPSVFLARAPEEAPDTELGGWYRRLIATVREHEVRAGAWRLIDPVGWPDNPSAEHVLAWSWSGDRNRYLVLVNLAAEPAQARIPFDWSDLAGRPVRLTDLLEPGALVRDGDELATQGLYVDLAPWQAQLFVID